MKMDGLHADGEGSEGKLRCAGSDRSRSQVTRGKQEDEKREIREIRESRHRTRKRQIKTRMKKRDWHHTGKKEGQCEARSERRNHRAAGTCHGGLASWTARTNQRGSMRRDRGEIDKGGQDGKRPSEHGTMGTWDYGKHGEAWHGRRGTLHRPPEVAERHVTEPGGVRAVPGTEYGRGTARGLR